MEAKDGSFGFDYSGSYQQVEENRLIRKSLDDGRKVEIEFQDMGASTAISETFEIEDINTKDMQRDGWQAILNNFKNYCENE
jgi:hypothetical protein